MKRPVKKRRGYAGGGLVDAAQRLASQVSQGGSDQADWRSASQAAVDRGAAKDYPGMYMNLQRADIIGDRMKARQGMPTKYLADQPEGYPVPGNARGGKVRKVMPAKKARR